MTEGKYKKCVACQNFIPEQATVCMYCNAAQPKEKVKKKPGKLRTAIGVLVFTFLGCMIIFALVPGQDDAPDSAAVPTFTNTPDLAQFINTPTPGPSPTPTSAVDPAYVDYVTAVTEQGAMIGEGLQKLGALMQAPDFSGDNWKLQVAASMVMVQLAHDALVGITPPPSMEGLHFRITDATEDCSDATKLLARGMDNVDSGMIDDAAALIVRCNEKMNTLTAEINAALAE